MRQEATADQIERWDELVAANPDGGNVLQSRVFAEVKARTGWKPRFFIYDLSGVQVAVLYLTQQIPVLGQIWYAPKGPGVATVEQLASFTKANLGLPAFLVKIEPELRVDPKVLKQLQSPKLGVVKAPRDIQLNVATVIVDLAATEEDILNSFKQKTRYNVRLAEKKGVTVEAVEATDANCQTMYDLMKATRDRAGFFLRDYGYFSHFWQSHQMAWRGQLFFAHYEGQVLAGDFATYLGGKGLYKDGGSIRAHSELQAPYLLQWRVMQWLKEHGVTEYDLHGTPPASEIENPNHPFAGLARFKTGFNAEITQFIGTYDQVLDVRKYAIWNRLGERIVTGVSRRVKNRLFY